MWGFNTMIQETSIESYLDFSDKLGDKQKEVLNAIRQMVAGTDTEIANYLGYNDINAIRPRRFELVASGLVREVGKRLCSITGKRAIVWGLGGTPEDEIANDCLSSSKFNKLLKDILKCNDFQKKRIKEVLQ